MFKNHDGLIEMTQFSDLYSLIMNKPTVHCPICNGDMKGHIYTGFDMNKVGFATFKCNNTICHFHRNELTIETTRREKA